MIRIASGVCVDANDIKEVIEIEEPPSVKIIYEVKQECEVLIYLDDKDCVKAFKRKILMDKNVELRQKANLEAKKDFALEFLTKLQEHFTIEEL